MFKNGMTVYLSLLLFIMQVMQPKISIAQDKTDYTLAVLDFQANGISEVEAKSLSNSLQVQIARAVSSQEFTKASSLRYTIVERSQMDKIFDQFDVQNTGCTDISCAVEFGKMLNAERILLGSVGLVGETYTINASIVDVETSKTIKVADYRFKGEVDRLLSDGIPDVVNQLMHDKKKSSRKLYYIAGISVVVIGAAAAIFSSSDNPPEPGDSGTIHIQLPVPGD